jgi:adenosylcobinamide kinase / adenosylcobinamide-phosphate guanylyltransferase
MRQYQSVSVTLVLGGVRSGKSRLAQRIAEQAARVTFVATAERRDDVEMVAKIERHRSERPHAWKTIEEPLRLSETIQSAGKDCDLLLIDCLTLFAANLLETYCDDNEKVDAAIDQLCLTLEAAPCSVVIVSNEVGSGVVPAYELGRRFRDLVGEINQRVAAVADTVLLMVAGLPFPLKGSIPVEVRP